MLNAHSQIHCGPELTFFRDFFGDYRDDPLRHLRFTATARDLVPEPDALEVLGGAVIELHERAARRFGKVRWADKSPDNVLYAERWDRLLEGRVLFVHVVRNPLDERLELLTAPHRFALAEGHELPLALARPPVPLVLVLADPHDRSLDP